LRLPELLRQLLGIQDNHTVHLQYVVTNGPTRHFGKLWIGNA